MTDKEVFDELENIERVNKKMTRIVLEGIRTGDVDRILEVTEMWITWNAIFRKKAKRLNEEAKKRQNLERQSYYKVFYKPSSVKN